MPLPSVPRGSAEAALPPPLPLLPPRQLYWPLSRPIEPSRTGRSGERRLRGGRLLQEQNPGRAKPALCGREQRLVSALSGVEARSPPRPTAIRTRRGHRSEQEPERDGRRFDHFSGLKLVLSAVQNPGRIRPMGILNPREKQAVLVASGAAWRSDSEVSKVAAQTGANRRQSRSRRREEADDRVVAAANLAIARAAIRNVSTRFVVWFHLSEWKDALADGIRPHRRSPNPDHPGMKKGPVAFLGHCASVHWGGPGGSRCPPSDANVTKRTAGGGENQLRDRCPNRPARHVKLLRPVFRERAEPP
jgi:hypothetical protein